MDNPPATDRHLVEFSNEIWSWCPRCQSPIVIRNGVLTCTACTLHHQRGEAWFGGGQLIASGRCGRCKEVITSRLPANHGMPPTRRVDVQCPDCSAVSTGTLRRSGPMLAGPRDPFFGLPLRLQAPCASHTLWVYNPAHLRLLRDHIAADLRSPTLKQSSMLSRLPPWMKSAKNRAAVERAAKKIEAQILVS